MSSKHAVKGKACDKDEMRRRRENHTVQLRKDKRDEGIEKRRKGLAGAGGLPGVAAEGAAASAAEGAGDGSMPAIPPVSMENLAAYCQSEWRGAAGPGVHCAPRQAPPHPSPPPHSLSHAHTHTLLPSTSPLRHQV